MRIDFPQGVPDECVLWLNKHVGPGATYIDRTQKGPPGYVGFDECAWFYERRYQPNDAWIHAGHPSEGSYIPSITIKDSKSKEALLFALTWSGV